MNEDPEFAALTAVHTALKDLDPESQRRVLDYVSRKLGLSKNETTLTTGPIGSSEATRATETVSHEVRESRTDDADDDTDGISPVAVKWMRRNGLTVNQLGKLFSLGTDEIDLVAKVVPGASKNQKTRSVALLKGLAAYLSSGVARISYEQIKETCLHYDAYDSPNHAKYIKGLSTELKGTKSGGFTLTGHGITAGTELIREVLGIPSAK